MRFPRCDIVTQRKSINERLNCNFFAGERNDDEDSSILRVLVNVSLVIFSEFIPSPNPSYVVVCSFNICITSIPFLFVCKKLGRKNSNGVSTRVYRMPRINCSESFTSRLLKMTTKCPCFRVFCNRIKLNWPFTATFHIANHVKLLPILRKR